MEQDIKELRDYIENLPEDAQTGDEMREIKNDLRSRVLTIDAQLRAVMATLRSPRG